MTILGHKPVLLEQVINCLEIKSGGIYADLTLGRAGHARHILQKIPNGKLIGFDQDEEAILTSKEILEKIGDNFFLINKDYQTFASEIKKLEIDKVDGILIDLGFSSPQVDDPERGFSYSSDGPLDMRFNQKQTLSAATIVNEWDEIAIREILRAFGDPKTSSVIAKTIVKHRPIKRTLELVKIIKECLPSYIVRQKNPAKAVFQALRIATNNEYESLAKILEVAPSFLNEQGKLVIITFNSIEDRIVKKAFQDLTRDLTGKLPIILKKQQWKQSKFLPTQDEIANNNRARSAILRVLTRT